MIVVHREGGAREGHVVRTGRVEGIARRKPQGEIGDPPERPVGRRSTTEFFLRALETGGPITGLCRDLIAQDPQEILETGLIAIEAGPDRRGVRTRRRSEEKTRGPWSPAEGGKK